MGRPPELGPPSNHTKDGASNFGRYFVPGTLAVFSAVNFPIPAGRVM
jgi:hypothetical protein